MARPHITKQISHIPPSTAFHPASGQSSLSITLTLDEYEAIRLVDYKALTQQEAAALMEVSRGTLQALYASARTKMARFIVEGTSLNIDGGNYQYHEPQQGGNSQMKIAVTYENGQIFQHFGHTEQFKIYDVDNGKIVSSTVVDTNGQGHGALAGFLANEHVEVLLCGGIGGGARNALQEQGITLYPGASGDADAQVASFLAGSLQYDPNTMCQHHGEGHTCGSHGEGHGEGHSCGGHGEGHGCGGHHEA